jgi:hypothetical protein
MMLAFFESKGLTYPHIMHRHKDQCHLHHEGAGQLHEASQEEETLLSTPLCSLHLVLAYYTVNPALLTSSFVWLIQLSLLHISLFKVTIMEFFTQGKCEFIYFLFALLVKMKILTL